MGENLIERAPCEPEVRPTGVVMAGVGASRRKTLRRIAPGRGCRMAIACFACVVALSRADAARGGTTIYVDASAPPLGDGSSWTSAFTDLQQALVIATDGTEVRIAGGLYRTTSGTNQASTFAPAPGVTLLGGFAGFGAPDPDLRDPALHPVTLSGTLVGTPVTNALHVVTVGSTPGASPVVLDGCIVQGGLADGNPSGTFATRGGGILQLGGTLILRSVTVRQNGSHEGGAGIYTRGTLEVEDSFLTENIDNSINDGQGGGIFGEGATVTVIGSTLSLNEGDSTGSGIAALPLGAVSGSLTLIETQILNHDGAFDGAGVSSSVPTLIEGCTIKGNQAGFSAGDFGGGLRLEGADVLIRNSLIEGNSASAGGGVMLVGAGVRRIEDTIIRGNACAGAGAGVLLFSGACDFVRVRFESNTASGSSSNGFGGAAAVPFSGTPITLRARFRDCVFVDNTAQTNGGSTPVANGGAIGADDPILVERCRFHGNTARRGGAIGGSGGRLTIQNSIFTGNHALERGGAIVGGGVPSSIRNCTIVDNSAVLAGGGIAVDVSPALVAVANSILWGNAVGASETSTTNLYDGASGTPAVDFCLVQGLVAPGSLGGDGNSGADPLFTDRDGPDNLQGTEDDVLTLGPGSPAIDAGANAIAPRDVTDADGDGDTGEFAPFDLGGDGRFADAAPRDLGCGINAIIDRGAFESAAAPRGLPVPRLGDLTGDGLILGDDLAVLLGAWGACPDACCDADLQADGFVNALDLAILLAAYGTD